MKIVRVVAAVIKSINEKGQTIIFATQRGYGDMKDGWEFPGGKIEPRETPQEALKREIMEEIETEIEVGELIDTVEYDFTFQWIAFGVILNKESQFSKNMKLQNGLQKDNYMM